jgi:hypothetical protein
LTTALCHGTFSTTSLKYTPTTGKLKDSISVSEMILKAGLLIPTVGTLATTGVSEITALLSCKARSIKRMATLS